MRKLILMLLFVVTCNANVTIKNRLMKASPGDYVVTEQGSNYSLMIIRAIDQNHLTLEEISIVTNAIDLKKINWKKWVENNAPGAISWTAMVFDLNEPKLLQCYSYLEKQWFFIEESDYFVKNLFNLPFRPTKDSERKKIGPIPNPGEIDRRKFWKPQLVHNGAQNKKPQFEILRGKWPTDKTKLTGCIFEIYLDAENREFPFPYWLEVQHPHYTFKVKTIDSGSNMESPMPLLKSK